MCFNLAEGPRCRICTDERRDAGLICVVEEPGDVIPVERTHEYRGRYHVLGGALSPIDGIDKFKSAYDMAETIKRLKKDVADKGIMFFDEIDQAKLAADAGVQLLPSTLLVFGNPPLGTLFLTWQAARLSGRPRRCVGCLH